MRERQPDWGAALTPQKCHKQQQVCWDGLRIWESGGCSTPAPHTHTLALSPAPCPFPSPLACRLFLSPYDLTPTYKDVHNKFSVRYFLNLVLVDEEDRRYFKQQEITLYRRAEVEGAPLLPGADATSRMSSS